MSPFSSYDQQCGSSTQFVFPALAGPVCLTSVVFWLHFLCIPGWHSTLKKVQRHVTHDLQLHAQSGLPACTPPISGDTIQLMWLKPWREHLIERNVRQKVACSCGKFLWTQSSVFKNQLRDRTCNREETWLPVDTNSWSRKFPIQFCQYEWPKVSSRVRAQAVLFFSSVIQCSLWWQQWMWTK